MRISDKFLRLAAIFASCATGHVAADDLTLAGGEARLSGTVRSITSGVVELASELALDPLLLKGESVEKIVFSSHAPAGDVPPTMVELSNGDLLPAIIESFDDQKLAVVSPEAGRMEIPRNCVKSLQLGIRKHKVIYQGPRGLEEWSKAGDVMKNWAFEREALVSRGTSVASMKLPLPRQFMLRFTLAWRQGKAPNFQIFFADPLVADGEPCDRYYLQFNSKGFEIKREASPGRRRYNTIATLDRSPEQYPDQRVQVEIVVNRDAARLSLFLNGEPEGEFADPIANVPAGSGIAIASNTPDGGLQEIRAIEVLEYDDSFRRHRSEDRGDPSRDSLISREDDRWTGRLVEIRNTGEGAIFVFKTDFQQAPLEIPGADVSTVFLSGDFSATDSPRQLPFVLRLAGDGSLGVSSCQFTGESAFAIHPFLGPLTFRRSGILAMERIPAAAQTHPDQ